MQPFILMVEIQHKNEGSTYCHFFEGSFLEGFPDSAKKILSEFFAKKAKETQDQDSWLWDHAAYSWGSAAILKCKCPGSIQTHDWFLKVEPVKLESL